MFTLLSAFLSSAILGYVLSGTGDDDVLQGSDEGDHLRGRGGDDTLFGAGGDDWLQGHAGNDLLLGEEGNDALTGHRGDDTMDGGPGNDALAGGSGADWLKGETGDDTLSGGSGNDLLQDTEGADRLRGGSGDDTLEARDGGDSLFGGAGDDALTASKRQSETTPDLLRGGPGDDTLEASQYADLRGGAGDDVLRSLLGTQVEMRGGPGDDTLEGGLFNLEMYGGTGDDVLRMGGEIGGTRFGFGEAGDDRLFAGSGSSSSLALDGGTDNDTLSGGLNDDTLLGGADDDILRATFGADQMTGGSGADNFFLDLETADGGPFPDSDVITDFDRAEDVIVISHPEGAPADLDDLRFEDTGTGVQVFDGDWLLVTVNGASLQQVQSGIVFVSDADVADLIDAGGFDPLPEDDDEDDGARVSGTPGADTLDGTDGNDTILGGDSGDVIRGGAGDDLINPGTDIVDEDTRQRAGTVTVNEGTPFEQSFLGVLNDGVERLDPDTVFGEDGADTIVGFGHDLDAHGGAGNDLLVSAETGIARLYGDAGDDVLVGEGGDTATDVVRFNNQRFADVFVSEQSYLDGGEGNDTIVTAEYTDSRGGAGTDTFIVRDPALEDVDAARNVISGIDTANETLVLTYAGDVAPDTEEVDFERIRVRDLPGGKETDPTSVLALTVSGTTYAYLGAPEGGFASSFAFENLADFEAMRDEGRIVFVPDAEVAALAEAAAARAAATA